jgi:hypothetical protein
MQPFEKLGAFYLGKLFDPDGGKVRDDLLLYEAKDLTTHAVCVGMTGSGKTGLCVSLLEEAAIDGIPTIAIDPKGDLGNLMLTFPELRPGDFRPWIDDAEAARKGQTVEQYATSVANLWTRGLGQWGQDGSRIARFRDAADVSIYTPGSSAGLPLRVLRSFDAPPAALIDDTDAFRERVASTVSGLLALLGIDADPIRSREHILLSNILHGAWEQGKSLDLGALIREIQSPPFDRIGVMDLDSFYPSKERFELSMALNSLLASPGFSVWMEGEPLSIPRLLWTEKGKPRISILSISHLSDTERMFFVTLLLNEIVAWMRTQPGTPSLRALVYMDEVFGYFPPTANPPSKTPMLTLLKQARAFGLGVVLATQNPVDLDYKGLSNAGTWFLGRLQTERDKARVLDGLEGATAASGGAFDRHRTEAILSGLGSRVFLMNNVHDDEPALFHTRWALSYLRGPLTRTQIRSLMAGREAPAIAPAPATTPAAAPQAAAAVESARPVVPPEVPELFLPRQGSIAGDDGLVYRPALVGSAKLHFVNARQGVDHWDDATLLTPLSDETLHAPWDGATPLPHGEPDFDPEPETGARFSELPSEAARAKSYPRWGKKLADHLYRNRDVTLLKCKAPKASSTVGESEGEFRARLTQLVREKRDLKVAKLQKRYAPKLARLNERIRKAEAKVGREQSQYGQQKMQTAISMGATVLGALFGRKVASVGTVGRASTTMRGVGRAARERGDIARAVEDLEARRRELADLEVQFEDDIAEVREAADPGALELKTVKIRPRKSDIALGRVALVWTPWRVGKDGIAEPIFR